MNIAESASEIIARGSTGLRFYETFLNRYPEFEAFFGDTDMQRQSNLLISAMVLIESHFAKENEGFAAYLKHLGSDHERLGIKSDDYSKWADAMLAALQDFHGDDWSDELKHAWDSAIENAVADILAGYTSR